MNWKKALKIALPVAGACVAAAAAAAFLIAPEKPDEKKKAPFLGRNIAHRGLHSADGSVPENSLPAFRAAVEAGYGVEFDVHLTADGGLVVFHDDDLKRMCGADIALESLRSDELRKYRLGDTQEHIPTLGEVLGVIGGETPIILELKRGHNDRELCIRTRDMLRAYRGDVCIESFDPRIVRWWRKHAPEYLRGQLSCVRDRFGGSTSRLQAFLLSNLLTNFLSRPHFVAYGLTPKKPLTVRLCEAMGAMRVAWTSHEPSSEKRNDTVIFEFYRPAKRYR